MKRLALLLFLSFPAAAQAVPIVLTAGTEDGFGGGVEMPSPSAALASSFPAIFDRQGFDQGLGLNGGKTDASIIHTFDFTGITGDIVAASLRFRIRAMQDTQNALDSDGLGLSFITDPNAVFVDELVYNRGFGRSATDAGLVQSTPWQTGDDVVVILDLAALALDPFDGGGTLSILDGLNDNGFLDVFIGDETFVDFIELTLDVDNTTVVPVPVPAALGLLGMGLAMMGFARRRARA